MASNQRNATSSRCIYYTCSYVPQEIIIAAGLLPKRLVPLARPSAADAYIHPNTCFYVRSVLAAALGGECSQAAGIVFANSCDGMRKLHDIWNEYVKEIPSFFIDVPKKKDPASIEFFASEFRRFATRLEARFPGTSICEEALNRSVIACNRTRHLMGEVFRLQGTPNSYVGGKETFELCMEGTVSSPEDFANKLTRLLPSLKEQKSAAQEPRLALTGTVVDRPDLIALLEESAARVVVLDTCAGVRHYDEPVAEHSRDTIMALAKRYLLKAPCARMQGFEDRFQQLKKLVGAAGAHGVVYSSVKFCDPFTYEVPLMRDRFREIGIPFLFLENDYEWTGLEQMRSRVEAFLETLV